MKNPHIILSDQSGVEIIRIEDIVLCQAKGSYSVVVLKDNKKLTVSRNLRWLQQRIVMKSFFRTHRSYYVNLSYIKRVERTDLSIILQNGMDIPVARSKKKEFWKNFNLFYSF